MMGVNDASPLKGTILVGDKFIAIDDVDVSRRNAVDISSECRFASTTSTSLFWAVPLILFLFVLTRWSPQ